MYEMQEKLFNGNYDPLQFSVDMEIFFCEHYNEIEKENKEVARIYNENLPEFCSEGEPNFDPTHMINGIRDEYNRAKAIYKAE
jgi:hypothetical protein